jgi:hypothetical protein
MNMWRIKKVLTNSFTGLQKWHAIFAFAKAAPHFAASEQGVQAVGT